MLQSTRRYLDQASSKYQVLITAGLHSRLQINHWRCSCKNYFLYEESRKEDCVGAVETFDHRVAGCVDTGE